MAEKKETKIEMERTYIIPLREAVARVPRYKRANKAVKTIKEFLVQHMQIRDRDLNKIRVDKFLNEFMWGRGIRNPPLKVKVKAKKQGDIVIAELAEMPESIKFKVARLEKRNESGKTDKKKPTAEAKTEEKTEEQKKEVEEKKAATVEVGQAMEKAQAKMAKHQSKGEKQKASVPRRMTMPK